MAKTTFAGPVYSKSGFITTGPANTVSLTADTTLTVAAHAGKILLTNDRRPIHYETVLGTRVATRASEGREA